MSKSKIHTWSCPFCFSNRTEIVTMNGRHGFFSFVQCKDCKAHGPTVGHDKFDDPILETVMAWNRGAVYEGDQDGE